MPDPLNRVHTVWAVATLALAIVSFWLGRAQTAELRARVQKLEEENRSLRSQLSRFETPERFDIDANERRALGALRTLHTALAVYVAETGNGYPAALSDLNMEGRPLIDTNLAAGNSTGYRITYQPAEPETTDGPRVAYQLSARPLRYEETGRRSFFSDESGVIRGTNESRAAAKSDPAL